MMDQENTSKIDEVPLIPMQKGMLFHAVTAPKSGVDVQHISMTLLEALDLDKFQQSWNRVIERHSVLRSAFPWENVDEPVGLIYSEATLPITEIDWSQLSTAESDKQFEALLNTDRVQGFDLNSPPLMRLYVIRMGESMTRCLWSFHHIILDGRSFPLVLQEVFQVYDGLMDGSEVSFPKTFPFPDFINILVNHDHSGSETYWRNLLDGISAPTPLGLSTNRLEGPVASATSNEVAFLSESVAQKLSLFAKDIGVTLNTLVQGAWGLLLAHYTGESEIVFGNTRSGRHLHKPANESVGLFINTVPVRLTITPDQTLVEYLRGLRAQQVSVRDHESTPLAQIQKWTDVDNSDSLFHTLVVFENYDLNSALQRNGGKWLKREFNYQGQTSFPLTLMAYSDSQITFRLEYDPHVYSQKVVTDILEHLKTLLQEMAERPHATAHSIPYLTDAEAEFLVKTINPQVSPAGLEETVYETIVKLAEKTPAKQAISDDNRTVTYGELSERANQFAHYLINLGVKPNEPVGICMDRNVDMVISMLAVLGSGGTFVPLDPSFPRERLAHMLEDSEMKVLISESDLISALPMFNGRLIIPNRDREEIHRQPTTPLKSPSRLNDTAYIIYTSGSTGKPKGVQVPHRALTNFMLTMQAEPGLTEEDVLTAVTTISFDISILEIILPLFVGGKLVLASQDTTTDGRALEKIMADNHTTVMQATPATWRMLIDSGWNGLEGLKILCGGEKLTNDLAAELLQRGDALWNMYGPTETTIWSLIANITDDNVATQNPLRVGRPIANTSLFILDESLQLVPVGVPGELCIGGQGVSLGYLNRSELTAEKFIKNDFGEGLLYRTGDVARYLPNGDVVCLGRSDNQLKIRGFRIEPGEVESALLAHAAVRQAVVTGRPTLAGDMRLTAYVIREKDNLTTVSELRKYASTRLPDYMVPTAWVFLSEFPLTDNGKINRKNLPEPSGERPELENPYVAPKSDAEKQISAVWKEILNVKAPGVHDNFFDLGGDSLLVVRVLSKLRNLFGTGLAVHDLYAARTIRTLAEKIESLQGDATLEESVNEQQIEELPAEESNDVAIIGMSGRFPGAENLDEFWSNLVNGVEGLRHLTEEELRGVEIHYDEYKDDPEYVAATGLLDDIDMFDASFFGIKPVEARTLDPQQRLWFETAWETLENGGYDPGQYDGKIGVFAGSFMNSYVFYNLLPDRDTIEDFVRLQAPEAFMHMINNERDYMPTRTAYLFDLKGPAINVQTACSTSLVAVNLACRSILSGESDMALAGGVAIFLPQERGYFYQEGGMRSADGHCRPFDSQASGTVFASGLGCVLLKKLDKALADGDNIVAVVKGGALNNDGTFKASYTAPSISGQADVIRQARINAGVNADSISYIEAHGTATPLGDPIEIAGLSEAFSDRSPSIDKIALGAVKSNIGHLDAAAGIAGLIKTALSLQNETIPPTLHYSQANSEIDFENSPFYVADKPIKWPKNKENPRRAGLSSFGVGGTNAHLILEESPELLNTSASRPRQLLLLSAKSATALDKQAENLAGWLEQNPSANLADVAFTLTVGRAQHIHRRIVVAANVAEAIEKLRDPKGRVQAELRTAEPEIVFMFPGQGAQFVGMGRELYESEAIYRDAIDQCAEILEPHLELDMRKVLFPENADDPEAAHQLKQTGLAQPAIFMVSYAQAILWQSWGITPDIMVGHSVGEFVAATISGVFSLSDALKLIAGRARLMQDLPGGSMRAIRMSIAELQPWLDRFKDISLAAVNAPAVCIVSGATDAIGRFDQALDAAEIETIELHTSHAFHSDMMDGILPSFAQLVDGVEQREPAIPLISTLTGKPMSSAEAMSSTYWTSQLRQAVLFSPAVTHLVEDTNRIFLEVGPGTNLSGSVRQHIAKPTGKVQSFFVIDSLGHARKQLPALGATLEAVGRLWMSGAEPNFTQYFAGEQRRRVALPTYPFERKRYWIDPPAHPSAKADEHNAEPSVLSLPAASNQEISTVASNNNMQANNGYFQPEYSPQMGHGVALQAAQIEQTNNDNQSFQQESLMGRNENIKQALTELLYDLSGIEIDASDHDTSFPELGFDSLTLTQVSTALRKKMKVSIRFRKLLEDVATINDLTLFCADALPDDAYLPAAPKPAAAPVAAPQAPQAQAPQAQMPQMQMPQMQMPQMQMPQMQMPQMQMPQMQMPNPSAMMHNPMQMQMMQMQQMMMLMQQQMAMMGQGGQMAQTVQVPGPVQTVEVEKIVEVEVGRQWPKAPEKAEDDTVNKVTFGPYKPVKKGAKGKLTDQQEDWLNGFMARLQAKTPTSKKIAQENRDVQADPRTVAGFRQTWKEIVYQIVTERSKGSRVWDVDGNEYVDITMGFGVGFLGHSPDFVTDAVKAQLDKGIEIGPQGQLAGEVYRLFRQVTGMERVSFCNTGSEALMASMRMARTITGRDKVVYFAGDYHGVFDEVLARPQVIRGELMTVPAAPGVTEDAVANAIILDYGTDASLDFIREHKDDIAAIIIETVQSRHPENRPQAFVKELRKITTECGAALVFDEVITGFRVHQGGMQQIYGVKPDIACYGKIIGGGIPIGVVAGSPRFMDTIDGGFWQYGDDSIPEVDLTFFAGTFVRHPMALAAAKAVLTFLVERGPNLQEWMNERTTRFAQDMNAFFKEQEVPIKINHYSSWFRVEVPTDLAYPDLLFYSLIEKGIYVFTFAQNCFFSIAHTDEDIEFVKQAFKDSVTDLQKGGFLPTGGNSSVPFPLTEAQKEIWLASQISEKAATSYNEGFSITLKGQLNKDYLVNAIQSVIHRHGALHSRFDDDGETQHMTQDKQVDVQLLDLADKSANDAQQALTNHIDATMSQPFDLKNGPLVRPSLVKLADNEHILFWVADHIVYDGWSAVIVISEIRALYNAASAGVEPELDAADSFREYVAWEQEATAGEEGAEILSYWKGQFETLPPNLDLPGDYSRPAARSFGASSVHYQFEGDLISQINGLAKTWKTSTFVVMLSAYKAMLHRLSGNEDLVVGIHTAGQAQAGLDNLVGHAVSILPIRSKPIGEMTFTQYVAQVKDSFLDAQDHQPFTFGKLLQNLNIPRDPSRSPLVEVVFNLDKKVPEEDFSGLSQEIREVSKQATNWDLFLNLYEEDGTLKADFDFNVDLFDSGTINGWLNNLSLLLNGIVANPDKRLADLSFFPDNGLSDDMLEWNQTEQIYPANLTLPEIVSRQAAETPSNQAIIDGDKSYTYQEIDQKVNSAARHFRAIGVSPGMLVGISLDRDVNMVVSALAVMQVGAAYVPLDPDYPADRLSYMIEDSGMPFIVTQSDYVQRMPDSVRLIVLDEEETGIDRELETPFESLAKPNEAAYMIYTSGSSGRPKGVLVPHQALVNFLWSMQAKPGMSADDVLVSVTTLSFDIAALELYLPLVTGGSLVIARPEVSTDGFKLAALLRDVGASVMQATPATWKLLLDSGWAGKLDLKMLCGGEPLSRQLANDLLDKGAELWNMYGPTETTIWSTIARIEKGDGPIEIGRPIANTQVYILNHQMRPVSIGVEGDLYIGGHGLALGYYKRPELTAEKFVANPFGDGRLYQTGDVAKYNADGSIVCLGRADNQVKVRGFRIELGEIEAVIHAHPSVTDAVVIVREDEPDDKRIVAYLIPAKNGTSELPISVLRDTASSKLPYYMLPAAWVTLDKFPLTPNGKIDRLAFPAPEQNRDDVATQYAAPESETEKHLAQIWAEVLKLEVDTIGVRDDFFELGGHSLLATRVISRIRQQIGVNLSLLSFFEGATVSKLSEQIGLSQGQAVASNSDSGDDREEFVI